MPEFEHKIVEEIGVLSEKANGWSTQLNLVSWGGREAKYDLRPWGPGGERMGKGISLSKEELKALKEILEDLEL